MTDLSPKQQFMLDVASTLVAVASGNTLRPGQAIASHLYLALGSNLPKYHLVRNALSRAGLVTYTEELVTITDAGQVQADRIAKAIEA